VGESTVFVRSHAQVTALAHDVPYETGIRLKEAPATQDPSTLFIRRAPQQGHAPHAPQSQPQLSPTVGGYSYQQPLSSGIMGQQPLSSGMMGACVMTGSGIASGTLLARTAPPASAPPQAPSNLPPSAPAPPQYPGVQHIMSSSAQDVVGEPNIYIRHAPQQVKEAPPRALAATNLIPLKLPGHCEGMPLFLEQVRLLFY
jgi:hypothetical protein